VPLGLRRKSVKSVSDAPEPDSDAFYQKAQQPRGIIDEAGAGLLDASVLPSEDAGGSSGWYKMGYTKTAPRRMLKGMDMLAHGDFETVLDYARWKVASLAEELAAGKIAPAPYRAKSAPCDQCEFVSLCPFDRVEGTYRDVPRMGREEALAAMREALGRGSEEGCGDA
jgi:hypothetical protein